MLFEQQALEADLDTLGLVGALGDVRAFAALVVDGRDDAVLGLGHIELGDHAERFGRQRH